MNLVVLQIDNTLTQFSWFQQVGIRSHMIMIRHILKYIVLPYIYQVSSTSFKSQKTVNMSLTINVLLYLKAYNDIIVVVYFRTKAVLFNREI